MKRLKIQAVGIFAATKQLRQSTGGFLRTTGKNVSKRFVRSVQNTHHTVARRPHHYLMRRLNWYKQWHEWNYHTHIHVSVLAAYVLVVSLVVFSSYKLTFAADLTNTWNFTDGSNFTFDTSTVEVGDGNARLKAQGYVSDASTAALLHLDETSGSTVANDSSGNGNNGTLVGGSAFEPGNLNNALALDGTGDYLSVLDSASISLAGSHTIEAWTKFNTAFSTDSSQDQGVVDKGSYKVYYDRTSGKINYEIASSAANSWTRQAGLDSNNSWDQDGKTAVRSTVIGGTDTYVGLGAGVGDAEVWKWNGTVWSQVGGDGKNQSWADQTFEDVHALAISGTTLYAGIGSTAGDGEVWSCEMSNGCSAWTKIGGDTVNGSWQVNTFEGVYSLTAMNGILYAGLGASANDAEVWSWNGTAWAKIGGDSLNSGWTINYEAVRSLTNDGSTVYAGLGDSAADAEVWSWNGASWTKLGGDGVNSGWTVADNIESVYSLDYFGGNLYAGTGLTAGDGDVWKFDGVNWLKIGGDGLSGGWTASTYEAVYALTNDGTNLYAGLGNGAGDGEIYSFNGSSWTKVGGDAVNGGYSTAQGDAVFSLAHGNGALSAGLYDSAGDGTLWELNGTTWTIIGGGFVHQSWGKYGLQSVESSATYNEKLYVGTGVTVAGNAMVWAFDGVNWELVGGQGVKGSWTESTYENVFSLQQYKGSLYAALGTTANDAEVWRYDGTTWTKVGGDGVNSGWLVNYEQVNSLVVYGENLYAGLGNTANDSEIWRWNGTVWAKIAGDGINSSWATGINIENVLSMVVYDGQLYAGLGSSTGDGEVWRYDGVSWTKIGGDGLASSWSGGQAEVYTMRVYDGKLMAGLGSITGSAEIWQFDGTTWSQIGGNDINGSWTGGTYERIRSMALYNGELYAGVGDTAGDGEVWRWNGTSWVQIGGDSVNGGWSNVIEYVTTLIDYKGKLYAGTGNSANIDAAVWSYGNNGFVSSQKTSQDTNWHHIAATYNGSIMKLFIDGVEDASATVSVTAPDTTLPLRVGSTFGSGGRGEAQGFFDGKIDEVRLSTVARTAFTSKPYSFVQQTIELATAAYTSGIKAYSSFTASETARGGTIGYRLSSDNGQTWLFWDGDAWTQAGALTNANTAIDIDSHIATFPVTFGGIKWQAVLIGDGSQQVSLNLVTIEAVSDLVAPETNAANIVAQRAKNGATLAAAGWTNGASPYFSWDSASDIDAGIYGYCLYLGQDPTADPVTTKGLLGNSLINTGSGCRFATAETSIDLAVAGVLGSPLVTASNPYYLAIKAIDAAGNVYPTTALFDLRFDNTPPVNPGFVSSPSGFINSKEATFTWPTSGGQAARDDASGIAGLQYRIEATSWYGDTHNGSGDSTDLLSNDGVYSTLPTPDYANITDGTNSVYFRTWDMAGNISVSTVSAALKVNTNGAPSEPQSVVANPANNSVNAFSFSWDKPAVFIGAASNLNYCYSINTLPSVSTCNYSGAGITSLSSGPYATQPGQNTLYVVAKDESNSINYDSYASINFTANTSAPGLVGNSDIVDVSIKATNNWRLAITWGAPIENGSSVSSYKIYRSTDGNTYALAGTSSSTTYIDAGLLQQPYFYRVIACDSTNNCSANSPAVSLIPTGKFIEPAVLTSSPKESDTTTKRTKIQWTTDRASDSKVAIGTQSGQYGAAEIGNSNQVVVHQIDLDNLAAGTTYYYIAKWTDSDGNTGKSQEYTFTTKPAPVIKEVNPAKVGLSAATINFTSVSATRVNLYYGESESFGGLQSINTSITETAYNIDIDGLKDGTKYYYQLSAFDSEGGEYKGNVFSFVTPSRPRITNLRFQPIVGEPTSTQSVTWTTNVPSTSTITYGKRGTNGADLQSSKLETEHTIIISGLEDDSEYFLVAQSRDADGNLAVSDQQVFKTALDTRPPTVSGVNIESSIRGTGAEARGQVIISWKTDEPSTSQVGYADGSTATVFNNKTSEDTQMTTEHIVILSNLPTSKVYSIQVMSYDKARNVGLGVPEASIIGRANESVLTVILSALERIFGL